MVPAEQRTREDPSMDDIRKRLRDLVDQARELHLRERQITLESVRIIGELQRYNAHVNLVMTQEQFAARIGLTPNQLWKRAQAARVIRYYPRVEDLVRNGEACISTVALLAPAITDANADLLLSGIKGKSKRDVRAFVSRVTPDGKLLAREGDVELRLTLTESEAAVLDRAREVLSAGGHVPSNKEILLAALDALLDRRDPMRVAARASARKAREAGKKAGASPGKAAAGDVTHGAFSLVKGAGEDIVCVPSPGNGEDIVCVPSPGKGEDIVCVPSPGKGEDIVCVPSPGKGEDIARVPSPGTGRVENIAAAPSPGKGTGENIVAAHSPGKAARERIPAALRHAVWLRDQGRCTYEFPDGRRCEARAMLEIDHVAMVCRGGRNELDLLALRCRLHNRALADDELGHAFMARKIEEARRARSTSRCDTEGRSFGG
jgi:hypothetical protein